MSKVILKKAGVLRKGKKNVAVVKKSCCPTGEIRDIESIPKASKVVAYYRVSNRSQIKNNHLSNLASQFVEELESKGFKVVAVVKEVSAGWAEERDGLANAVSLAEENGAIVVVPDVSRLIRSKSYHSQNNPNAVPTEKEIQSLFRKEIRGVKVASLLHPKATPQQIRQSQQRRGKKASKKRDGRPKVKQKGDTAQRKRINRPKAIFLFEDRVPIREIGRRLEVSSSTVYGWIKKYKEDANNKNNKNKSKKCTKT